ARDGNAVRRRKPSLRYIDFQFIFIVAHCEYLAARYVGYELVAFGVERDVVYQMTRGWANLILADQLYGLKVILNNRGPTFVRFCITFHERFGGATHPKDPTFRIYLLAQ